ncbi:hypothetical protein C1H46_002220 [Malus baccata]|uniref:Uncharacterized protein n=1 Tax=Malus baccata TaxID=106549 RepID=A0A540NNP7_MALBA|nr:hypothetical protein C1H46_002220 [Malus baccata]
MNKDLDSNFNRRTHELRRPIHLRSDQAHRSRLRLASFPLDLIHQPCPDAETQMQHLTMPDAETQMQHLNLKTITTIPITASCAQFQRRPLYNQQSDEASENSDDTIKRSLCKWKKKTIWNFSGFDLNSSL